MTKSIEQAIKHSKISRRILDRAEQLAAPYGQPRHTAIREAFDEVLGAGAYDQLISDLYDDLRKVA